MTPEFLPGDLVVIGTGSALAEIHPHPDQRMFQLWSRFAILSLSPIIALVLKGERDQKQLTVMLLGKIAISPFRNVDASACKRMAPA